MGSDNLGDTLAADYSKDRKNCFAYYWDTFVYSYSYDMGMVDIHDTYISSLS